MAVIIRAIQMRKAVAILAAVLCCASILLASPTPGMADAKQDELNYRKALEALRSGDSETAARLFRPLAEGGDAYSQYILGGLYHGGHGVPVDMQQSAMWNRKAAEQGFPEAQYMMACFYWEGQGVPQDYTQSAKWMRKAAEQGHAAAQFVFGVMHFSGDGVPIDYVKGYMWLTLADAGGEKEAREQLDDVATRMTPQQIAEAERLAAKWRRK